jgi:hypothetical protein
MNRDRFQKRRQQRGRRKARSRVRIEPTGMSQDPPKQASALSKYCTCMEEIKLRLESIRGILDKRVTTLYPITNVEGFKTSIQGRDGRRPHLKKPVRHGSDDSGHWQSRERNVLGAADLPTRRKCRRRLEGIDPGRILYRGAGCRTWLGSNGRTSISRRSPLLSFSVRWRGTTRSEPFSLQEFLSCVKARFNRALLSWRWWTKWRLSCLYEKRRDRRAEMPALQLFLEASRRALRRRQLAEI